MRQCWKNNARYSRPPQHVADNIGPVSGLTSGFPWSVAFPCYAQWLCDGP